MKRSDALRDALLHYMRQAPELRANGRENASHALSGAYGKTDWRSIVYDELGEFLEKHSQEIVDAASSRLYEYMRRKKIVSEAVDNVVKRAVEEL